jgi:acyl-coenzyme A synthetase/AMP-(fatty) acid ligase
MSAGKPRGRENEGEGEYRFMQKSHTHYHIALDCLDKHAHSLNNKNKTALIAIQEGQPQPTKLTFSQLMGLTNRMANALAGIGIKKSDRALLRLPNGPEFPITFLGAMKLGALPVPTSPLYTWRELKYLLEDSGAAALVATQENLPEEIWRDRPSSLKKIILVSEKESPLPKDGIRWQNILKAADAKFQSVMTDAEDPAFWLYTSGTTGEPKAAIHAHRSIPAHDERCRLWLGVRMGDVIFNTSGLNWSYALTGMLDVWRHGLTAMTYDGELSAEKISAMVHRHGISVFMSVPGLYRRLSPFLKGHPGTFGKVRLCLSAGENLLNETREKFRKSTGQEIFEGLGMTENSVYLIQPSQNKLIEGSLGKPVFPEQIKILRKDLSECPTGETGILATHKDCPGLMLGYYEGSATPKLPLAGEWFLSGDLAHTDHEGNFYFDGRRDDIITAGGYRISPLEIEWVLNQHPEVEESMVREQREGGNTLITAQLVLRKSPQDPDRLRDSVLDLCRNNLAAYKIPRKIIFCKQLPKTVTGKLKRKNLSE